MTGPTARPEPLEASEQLDALVVLRNEIAHLAHRLAEQEAVIARVRAVHEPIPAADYGVRGRPALVQVCTGCGQDDGNWQYWPCPTIRALGSGGEQS